MAGCGRGLRRNGERQGDVAGGGSGEELVSRQGGKQAGRRHNGKAVSDRLEIKMKNNHKEREHEKLD